METAVYTAKGSREAFSGEHPLSPHMEISIVEER